MTWIGRSALEALSPVERESALAELRAAIDGRLAHTREWETFWPEARAIIEELRGAGHDLWSHDSDGERRALWGWDYMRMETAGWLQIQFDFMSTCATYWRGVDGRLGVDRADEDDEDPERAASSINKC